MRVVMVSLAVTLRLLMGSLSKPGYIEKLLAYIISHYKLSFWAAASALWALAAAVGGAPARRAGAPIPSLHLESHGLKMVLYHFLI
jgi:hypothetical protein